ncbi:MAG: hypothetical protein DWQ54_19930 [Microcystis flos-aquae TF09]|nr:MAG: hypothetical protein DWQ54_19930 [Microcystis flos-aquae TF09]
MKLLSCLVLIFSILIEIAGFEDEGRVIPLEDLPKIEDILGIPSGVLSQLTGYGSFRSRRKISFDFDQDDPSNDRIFDNYRIFFDIRNDNSIK